jgi:membrane protease YdiL (CAAX protease family)
MSGDEPAAPEKRPCIPLSLKEQQLELAVFLFLIVPSLAYSFIATGSRTGGTGSVTLPSTAVAIILRDLALVALILFFLWHNVEPVKKIGWTLVNGYRDAALALILFIPLFYLTALLDTYLTGIGFTDVWEVVAPTPAGLFDPALALILVIVVAIAEETIFRGYIILRFKGVSGNNVPIAVILSSVIFAIGHGYEGSAGLITVGVMGLIFALIYVWRESLVAPIILHFLQDLTVIVLIPYILG